MTDPARCRTDEHGISLIEMIIAMMVLSVALLAFAQVLIGSLRATREAEDTQVVTAASMEMIENLVGLDWDEAALYANDVAAADTRWSDRLDGGGTFDGHQLVTMSGPASVAERDPEVPTPSWTVTRDGLDYTYDLYPVWVDRSAGGGDGVDDTKRFVVIATWTDPVRGPQELRTVGERAPTQAEAGSNASGGRFLLKYATPTLVTADATTGQIDKVAFNARTNVPLSGAVTGTFSWYEPLVDGSGTVTGYAERTETVTLNPTTAAVGGVGGSSSRASSTVAWATCRRTASTASRTRTSSSSSAGPPLAVGRTSPLRSPSRSPAAPTTPGPRRRAPVRRPRRARHESTTPSTTATPPTPRSRPSPCRPSASAPTGASCSRPWSSRSR